jgi:hypothetical protein
MRIAGIAILAVLMTAFCASAQAEIPSQAAPAANAVTTAPSKEIQAIAAKKETVGQDKTVRRDGVGKHRKVAAHKKSKKLLARRHQRLAQSARRLAHLTKSQGGFYMPLVHAGMKGRYDIAGWHGSKPSDNLHAVRFEPKVKSARSVEPKDAIGITPDGRWYVPSIRKGMGSRYDLTHHQSPRGSPV